MKLVNAMESIVLASFQEFCKNYKLQCSCEKCKLDILSITLNNFQPKYISSNEGEVLVKALFSDMQLQYDILRELTKAAIMVERYPKH